MSSNLALVRDQFTRQAIPFSKAPAIRDAEAIAMLLKAAEAAPGQSSLDVACGPGLVVAAFGRVVGRAVGVDATPAMIDRAKRVAEADGVAVELRVGLATALPFHDASFDIVTCRFAFHHFDQPLSALKEMARVTKPGGRIVVMDGVAPDDARKARNFQHMERVRDPSTTRYQTVEGFQTLFWDAGLPAPEITPSRLTVDRDSLLSISFPDPGQEEALRGLLDLATVDDGLGMTPQIRNGKVILSYQTAIFACAKP